MSYGAICNCDRTVLNILAQDRIKMRSAARHGFPLNHGYQPYMNIAVISFATVYRYLNWLSALKG